MYLVVELDDDHILFDLKIKKKKDKHKHKHNKQNDCKEFMCVADNG